MNCKNELGAGLLALVLTSVFVGVVLWFHEKEFREATSDPVKAETKVSTKAPTAPSQIKKIRISWEIKKTGVKGHGDWFGEGERKNLEIWVEDGNKREGQTMTHWIEEKTFEDK